jgi:DnaJ-class molecular chaperone
MKNSKIIKKVLEYPCYCCNKSIKGKTIPKKNCKACNGTGFFKDEINYIIYKEQAFETDNIG